MEELAKEEKRRSQLRAQIQRENEMAEQYHREEGMRIDSYHIGNGYVELVRGTGCDSESFCERERQRDVRISGELKVEDRVVVIK